MHWAVDNPFISTIENIHQFNSDSRIEEVVVETVTGDSQVEKYSIEKIDILKIDVEGHDLSALKGFSKSLSEDR